MNPNTTGTTLFDQRDDRNRPSRSSSLAPLAGERKLEMNPLFNQSFNPTLIADDDEEEEAHDMPQEEEKDNVHIRKKEYSRIQNQLMDGNDNAPSMANECNDIARVVVVVA